MGQYHALQVLPHIARQDYLRCVGELPFPEAGIRNLILEAYIELEATPPGEQANKILAFLGRWEKK